MEKADEHNRVIELEHALEYAHKSFINIANQRLKIFYFFIIYIIAVSVGLYELLLAVENNDTSLLYLFVSLILIGSLFTTLIFWLLEWRNRKLVRISKNACIMLEEVLICALAKVLGKRECANKFEGNKLKIMKNCREDASGFSHGNLLFFFFGTVFVLQSVLVFVIFCKKFMEC